jgi:hypothetical protein
MRASVKILSKDFQKNKRKLPKNIKKSYQLNSGARTGVLSDMLVGKVYTAELHIGKADEAFYVVSVHDNKTAYERPVTVPSDIAEYDAVLNICYHIETTLTKDGFAFNF